MGDQEAKSKVSGGPYLPRGLLILLGLAAATVTVGGIKGVSGLIGPSFLALVLMITVFPIRGWLVRKGAPSWVATLAVIFTVYGILIALIVALVASAGQLVALVPQYTQQINDSINDIGPWLKDLGVKQAQIDDVVKSLDVGKLVGYATDVLQSILGLLTNAFFIGILVLFIGLDATKFPTHLLNARGERPLVVDALISFSKGTRKYFAVSAAFGLIVAIIDWIALLIIGVPAAAVWGVLAFVTNFIPNIGFVIGVIPPAVIALLDGGVAEMITVIVVYSLINFVIQSVIQPKVVGDALGLSTTLTFLSLVFWAWVLGPIGALLAIPMTLLAKALLVDVDPEARWVIPLLSGSAARDAPEAVEETVAERVEDVEETTAATEAAEADD